MGTIRGREIKGERVSAIAAANPDGTHADEQRYVDLDL